MDFLTIDYLADGNQIQKTVFELLVRHAIFEKLKAFDPILVGTFPIGINVENSDLDIICEWKSKSEFEDVLRKSFREEERFYVRDVVISGVETIIANFFTDGFEVEIFGQNVPTQRQNAYHHMIVEHKILKIKGDDFKRQIIELKKTGIKTEPAFGQLLGLENPYADLLRIDLNR